MTIPDPNIEYKKEEVESARQEYLLALHRPWVQRRRGIPHDWIMGSLILGVSVVMLLILFGFGNRFGFGLRTQNIVFLICSLTAFIFWFWLPEQIYGVKTRTTRHVFWKYPAIRRVIHAFQEPGEKFRRHLPVLILDGKRYFMINYHRPQDLKRHGYQKRIGIVLLNESMQVVDNDELFSKVYLIENLSFLMGTAERTKDMRYVRDQPQVVKVLKQCEKVVAGHQARFEQQGVAFYWQVVMASFPFLYDAVDESLVIFTQIHEKVRKALGYSFALEFLYEDALQLHEVRKTYIRHMNTSYKLPIHRARTHGSMLIVSLVTEQKPGDRKVLLTLDKMKTIEEGLLKTLERFEIEGVVQPEDFEFYHRKVELARKIGWPIARE